MSEKSASAMYGKCAVKTCGHITRVITVPCIIDKRFERAAKTTCCKCGGKLLMCSEDEFDQQELARMRAGGALTTPGEWAIDTSTGRAILVKGGCSVIEEDDARLVLSLIAAANG